MQEHESRDTPGVTWIFHSIQGRDIAGYDEIQEIQRDTSEIYDRYWLLLAVTEPKHQNFLRLRRATMSETSFRIFRLTMRLAAKK